MKVRIAYFGTPAFAVPGLETLIASRHDVVLLVSQPDRPRGRGQKLQPTATKVVAEASGVPVAQPVRLKDPAFHDQLRALDLDLGVVAAYGRIIPDAVLAIPRHGMINIHASILPRYRGAAPIHRSVIAGDPETGVSIMRVVTELDAGPVFDIVRRRIGPDETTPEVERDLAAMGAALALNVIEQMADGTAIETPQAHALATHAPRIERDEGQIEWTLPAGRIHNLVRGLQPWPLVSAVIGGVRCRVLRTRVTEGTIEAPPGTLVEAGRDLVVAAGGGSRLEILELQPEGKRVMTAREFLAGRAVPTPSRITST